MLRWRCAAGAVWLPLLIAPSRPAAAQTSLHATGTVSAAYTDNAFGAADNAPAGRSEPVETVFFLLTPGALLHADSPRSRYTVSYQRHFAFFLESPDNDSAADTAAAQAAFLLSPLDTLGLALTVTHSSFTGLLLDAASVAGREARAGYEAERLRADLLQSYDHKFTPTLSLTESATFGVILPLEARELEPLRYRTGAELGVEHIEGRSAYAAVGGATLFRTAALSSDLALPEDDAILGEARGRLRHDLGLHWSSELSAGIGVAHDLDGRGVASPIGNAALYFEKDAARVELRYNHAQNVNLETFQVLLRDEVSLNAGVPLSRRHFIELRASSALSHRREILEAADARESVNVWLSDVRVDWRPSWLGCSLHYQHLRQFDASEGAVRLTNLTRNLLMLSVAGTFPERHIAPVPLAEPTRVDDLRITPEPDVTIVD